MTNFKNLVRVADSLQESLCPFDEVDAFSNLIEGASVEFDTLDDGTPCCNLWLDVIGSGNSEGIEEIESRVNQGFPGLICYDSGEEQERWFWTFIPENV